MNRFMRLFLTLCLVVATVILAAPGMLMAQSSGADSISLAKPDAVQAAPSNDAGPSRGPGQPGTGLKEPTPQQSQWMKKNFPVIETIQLNQLALERINVERQARGLDDIDQSQLNIVRVGEEVLISGGSRRGTMTASAGILPASVDNSQLPAFPPIRSQGGIGSCAAWATTYYQFTYENNLARGTTASNGDNNNIFSPKWTYNLINGGEDGGSYFSDAYAVEMKHGAATWAQFPYDSNYLQWSLDPAAWRSAINYRPLSMGQIYNADTNILIEGMKTQLANGHVLVIATYVSSWVQSLVSNDPATGLDDSFVNQKIASYLRNTKQGGHAMTVVGYNDDLWCDLNKNGLVDIGEKGAFKIANSWGTSDWNSGYRWVCYDALRSSSNVANNGTWPATDRSTSGIFWSGNVFTLTANADYTPSMVAEVTLNSANRGQLVASLGTGSATSTKPSSSWGLEALYYSGGSYAFNGTTTACDGTFYFDFSDLAASASGDTRWFTGLYDSASGATSTIKSFNVYQVTSGGDQLLALATNVPRSIDAGQIYAWADSDLTPANQSPIALMTASPTSGNAPLEVSFDGSPSSDADGQIISYEWDFGDGTNAAGELVSHTYSVANTYIAKLTVKDDQGATDAISVTITAISTNQLPQAVISASPKTGSAPLIVAFNGSASSDTDGQIAAYAWVFGDGTSGNGATVNHIYAAAGSYNAKLTVTDNEGAASSAGIVISVSTSNKAPVAKISVNKTTGKTPLAITFNGSQSKDPDGKIVAYKWTFGDGSTGTGLSIKHTYTKKGTFSVTLTVTDNKGATGSANITIGAISSSTVTAPGNLTASVKNKTVTLTWKDKSNNESGFYIERWNGSSYVQIGTIGANTSKYSQTVASGSYTYRVQAFNAQTGSVSEYSNAITISVK